MDEPELVSVRHATIHDLDAPVVGGGDGEYREQLETLLTDGAADGGRVALLVATATDGRVVGRVGIRTASAGSEILGLIVEAKCRRQGVARSLVVAAEAWASAVGCTSVRLSVGQDNAAAIRLYDGLDYRIMGSAESEGLVDDDGRVIHEPELVWVCRKDLA